MPSPVRHHLDSFTSSGSLSSSLTDKAILAVAATGLMAVSAHISLPLPFSPIPFTLQSFAVLLIGMTLGPATAFAAMVLYLAEGAMGLPVFSPTGPGGVAQLLGPTAGYLFSYPLAVAAAGWGVRMLRAIPSLFIRGLAASAGASFVIFALGASWLASVLHLHAVAAWHLAIAPFLPGEIVKIAAAATLFSTLHRWQQS
ncbi:biotin transporter BioY [Granulicella arctica]|uniref:Biotin transporter n=1 Tax=Granulicella arctica TaxID=940613 RepID=A0A7Y9PHI7_9BACT|nr:biotin transporter BioY [Granulicella arctica]NYF79860.1 biotin transport system substrate-specific component [Granulicella arctica]